MDGPSIKKMVPHFLYKLAIVPDPSFTFLGPWELKSSRMNINCKKIFDFLYVSKIQCTNLCIPKQHIYTKLGFEPRSFLLPELLYHWAIWMFCVFDSKNRQNFLSSLSKICIIYDKRTLLDLLLRTLLDPLSNLGKISVVFEKCKT